MAISVVLTYVIGSAIVDPPGPAYSGPIWIAWMAALSTALPLVFRRRRPVPVLLVVLTAATITTAAGVVGVGVIVLTWVPVGLALYTAATVVGRFAAVAALVGGVVAAAVTIPWLYLRVDIASAPNSEVPLWWQVELGVVVVVLVTSWAIGRLIRWRRALQAEAAQQLAREMVAGERLRIARELHDIVGHSLSLIAVKASVANHIAVQRPEAGQEALRAIEQTSRSALTEIRRLLDVLRDDSSADLTPTPGTADLPELVRRTQPAGLRTDLTITGTEDLPQALDLTIYRIVQESLTNVIKHAGASHCTITVAASGGSVRIDVTDDGGGRPPSNGRGQGLIGMRERVSLYGGQLTTGPVPQGSGFRVTATIPLEVPA
ncbi:sensor histidine kinase [Actinoplanes sp. OR16]|uniref:sensor histidine kinase n=1 Tax=Actinoplanes sp. OR16 TaxID=946334 RepID=UPI001E44A474|nr:sensor histidine kinase [Actinoplanes sp. OR16]